MPARTVVTIGNFDGVHLGHQALMQAAREAAGGAGRVIALAFDPHPVTVLRPQSVPQRLTTFDERRRLLREFGVDEVVAIEPTPQLLGSPPEIFIQSVVEQWQPGAMVEGPDFRFGHDRAGDVELLARLGVGGGFELIVVPPAEGVLSDHTVVTASSSLVRWLLERGRVEDARRLLGRPYEVRGTVTRGDQRGRLLGVPTANVCPATMLPGDGVYFGRAVAPDGRSFAAAINVGVRPTFKGSGRRCEAHLIDADLPLDQYGWECSIQFDGFLRNELPFEGVQAVKAQILRDIERTRDLQTRHVVAS